VGGVDSAVDNVQSVIVVYRLRTGPECYEQVRNVTNRSERHCRWYKLSCLNTGIDETHFKYKTFWRK